MTAVTAGGGASSSKVSTPEHVFAPGHRLGRYEVIRHIGAGGMGVVYQARDTQRGTVVALKTLHRLEPEALLRLKNEFRFVANVTHPNLVSLHELLSVGEQWFFTMEYIEGEELWMRLQRAAQASVTPPPAGNEETVTSMSPGRREATPSPARAVEPGSRADSPPDTAALGPGPLLPLEELRDIFGQIALAIHALHSAKKLHCDIKPRNIILSTDGRAVLLDFGLSKSRAEQSVAELAGTPAYISPEQISGLPATEASDWYSFGVMLYEALSGRKAVMRSRPSAGVPPLSPRLPEDLRTLCSALMQSDPLLRPTGSEVLARLGHAHPESLPPAPRRAEGLIGREAHLASLWDAYAAMSRGQQPVVVHVQGLSGLGKTELVHRFFEALGERREALVLGGRCYERESMPYKAFDPLVDSLTRYLQTLSPEQAQALAPPHLPELLRIFPVLRQVPAFSRVEPSPLDSGRDQQELRLRAFRGLKELLTRLSHKAPLVLHIDDLQWGDPDSTIALGELLDPPDAPRLLLLCCYRTAEGEAASLLAAHRARARALETPLDMREVEVGPLSEAESRQLAASLLQVDVADPRVGAIAREAHGSPFFIEELVHTLRSRGAQEPALESVTLEQVVLGRVGQLSEPIRRLLELVAVAGRPLPQGFAAHAARLQGDPHTPWTTLRSNHLVRTRGGRQEDAVECYHDRIRESVYNHLPATVRAAHHLRLATVLEEQSPGEVELLARHFREAGVREKAGRYALIAGDQAAQALAFERAAELYREARESLPGETSLVEKQADALVNAGRCAQAAPLYLEAARSTAPDMALELRRRAAEQYLAGGCIPEGVAALKPLVTELGLHYPASPQEALQGIIEQSIQLQSGGATLQAPPPDAARLQRQADVAWSAAKGLGSVDILRGGYFSIRSTLLSAQAGDPRRTARGLCALGLVTVCRGTPADVEQGQQLFAAVENLLGTGLEDAQLAGFYTVIRGMAAMGLGQWRRADRLLMEGNALLEERCTGVSWECSQARVCDVYSLIYLGELREAANRGNRWLRTARETGDLYGKVSLELHLSAVLLAADDPEAVLAQLREAVSGWTTEQFTPQHLFCLVNSTQCELYRGNAAAAWKTVDEAWKAAEHSMGWQFIRVMAHAVHAGAAVALAWRQPSERERLLAVVRQDVQLLQREDRHYARGMTALLLASMAALEGRTEESLRELDEADARFTEAEMALHAACARRRKGELLGGEVGRELIAGADAVLRGQGIRNAARWADMYAPGFTAR